MKSRNAQKKSGAGQVPQTSRTGDVATDAFSRAIANSNDVASPIAQSLFAAKANAVHREVPTSPPTHCDAMPNAAQRTASTSNNVSPIAMSLFPKKHCTS
jgi:hypothetical protein